MFPPCFEHAAHLGHGPVAIVGQRLDQERHPGRAVPFVRDGIERSALGAAQRTLDRPVDVVRRDVVRLRSAESVLERQVGGRIVASAFADSALDGADVLADDLAALIVVGRLLALDLRPLVVTCQAETSSSDAPLYRTTPPETFQAVSSRRVASGRSGTGSRRRPVRLLTGQRT